MSKLFKVMVAVALVFWSVPAAAEIIDSAVTIPITVDIAGSASLTVETYNVSDNAPVVPLAIGFTGAGTVELPPAGNPWIVSDQYVRLVYSSNYATWGIRIVTDNEDLEGDPNDVIDSIIGNAIAPGDDGVWGTDDDVMSYSGLLGLTEISKPLDAQNPAYRAAWAWQVFADPQPAVTPPTCSIDGNGALVDNDVGPWNADWAYIADKNDDGYNSAILEDADGDGQVDDLTYGMIVVGGSGSDGNLAQHPAADPKPGDGDIVVYIAAKFANNNYVDGVPTPITLPPDTYSASLYIELIHE